MGLIDREALQNYIDEMPEVSVEEIRAKAIDEFAKRLHALEFDNAYGVNVVLTPKEIDEIAEQLKGGAE